jgi:hypothetical protein
MFSATYGWTQAIRCPSLLNEKIFPADNPWHFDISKFPVHPNSNNLVASVGTNTFLHPDFGTVYLGAPNGIPYIAVGAGQSKLPINFTAYGTESDPGPYPIPLNAFIEGGSQATGDRHVLAVDTSNHVLYELDNAFPQSAGWNADCGAKFDLRSNALRTAGWTSADAAGLPILAGLVRYDETVIRGEIDHAIRMSAVVSRKSYLYPARHQAGSTTDTNAPPMGQRYRLKAIFDTSGYPASVQPILRAMKKYGLIMADNGSNWYFSGAPDDRWSDNDLNALKRLKGSDFEAVLSVDAQGNPIVPASLYMSYRLRPLSHHPVLAVLDGLRALPEGALFSLTGRRLGPHLGSDVAILPINLAP